MAIRHVDTIAAAPPSKSQKPTIGETTIPAPMTGGSKSNTDGSAAAAALALSMLSRETGALAMRSGASSAETVSQAKLAAKDVTKSTKADEKPAAEMRLKPSSPKRDPNTAKSGAK